MKPHRYRPGTVALREIRRYQKSTELLIRKQRNGPVGMVKLAFLGQYTRFENLAFDQYGSEFE